MKRENLTETIIGLIPFLVLFSFLYLTELPQIVNKIIVGPDWRGLPYDLNWGLEKYLYTWSDFYFGTSFPYNLDFPFFAILGSISPILLSNIFLLIPLPLSALSMYLFFKKHILNEKIFAYLASFVYTFNPLTLERFYWAGALVLWTYALTPLFMYFFLELLQSTIGFVSRKKLLCTGLILFFLFLFRPQSLYTLAFISSGFIFYWLKSTNLKKNIRWLFLKTHYFLWALIANLPYLFRSFSSSSFNSVIEASVVQYSYAFASFDNILRLFGEPGYYQAIFGYFKSGLNFSYIGFIIPLLSFLPLLTLLYKRKILFTLYLSLIITITPFLIYYLCPEPFSNLIALNAWTFVLRSPSKLLFALSFELSLLFGIGAFCLFNFIKQKVASKKWVKPLIFIFLVFLLTIYNYPALTCEIRSESNQRMLRFSYFFDPTSYSPYLDHIEPSDDYRILILPYTYSIETATRNILSNYRIATIAPDSISTEPNTVKYWSLLSSEVIKGDSKTFSYLLKYGGIKYVLIDKRQTSMVEWGGIDAQTREINLLSESRGTGKIDNYIYLQPEKLIDFIEETKNLTKSYEDKNIAVYENTLFKGEIFNSRIVYAEDQTYLALLESILGNNVVSSQNPSIPYDACIFSETKFLNGYSFNKVIYPGHHYFPIYVISSDYEEIKDINQELNTDRMDFSVSFHLRNIGEEGWRSVEFLLPENIQEYPNGVQKSSIYYKNESGCESSWKEDGFHDLVGLDGLTIPTVLYRSQQEGQRAHVESFSMGSFDRKPGDITYSNKFIGFHKRVSFYMQQNQSLNVKITFYLDETKSSDSFSQTFTSYLTKSGFYDVYFLPTSGFHVEDIKMVSENITHVGTEEKGYVVFSEVNLSPKENILTIISTSLTDFSEAQLLIFPKNLKEEMENKSVTVMKAKKIDPTRHIVEVNASNPFFLVFTNSYNPNWVASIGKAYTKAFPLTTGMNGFYINKTGNFKVELEFLPQRVYELELTVSLLATGIILAFILFPQNLLKKIFSITRNKKVKKKRIVGT